MIKPEIAEAMKNVSIIEMAQKTEFAPSRLTDDEKTVIAQLDKHFKKIGETGADTNREIATFIEKTIQDEYYNAPSEILDYLFDRGTIGEFDDIEVSNGHKSMREVVEHSGGVTMLAIKDRFIIKLIIICHSSYSLL